MSSQVTDRVPKQKKPPGFGLVIAMMLEVTIFSTFVMSLPDRKAGFGAFMCIVYFYFSASKTFLEYMLEDD